FNGDGKMDLCLVGGGRVVLSQNGGDSFTEVSLPGVSGARAAVWADYNADGLPDLLLATASGPMLLTNLGKGSFRDDSHLLPAEPAYNLTCAAWIDQNGDGRPDILLGNGWHGLRLYRNSGPTSGDAPPEQGPWRFVGPFDNTGRRGLREPFAPEKDLNLKGDFTGKAGRKIAWKEGKFVDGKINSLALFDNNQDAVIYLHREIRCPKAMKLPVSLGNDEGLAVWLNGKLLVAQENDRACAPDQLLLELDLKAGSNDLLLKFTQGIGEWAFYFQPGTKSGAPRTWNFEDVSDAVGLGVAGLGSKEKGDALTVADLDGDGKLDFLYSAGTGRVARNEGNRFVEMVASGLQFPAGKVGPIPGDYDGDGLIDLVVPLAEGLRLFRNQGKGSFADVTRAAGLGDVKGRMVSADWGDLDNDGKLDLVVGCLRGSNRFFRGKGDGTFSDASESIGLNQRVFNTQAIRLLDLNGDGILDLACNNEGQEPCVLLANPDTFARQTPVTVLLAGKQGILGSQVRVLNQDGKLVANQQILGGEGRGGQTPPLARFALAPGSYRLEWLLSTGRRGQKPLVVEKTHVKTVLDSAVLPGE
ncbi:MAG: FG-GAP repeat domain-containing protein, partial [Gemmataceae bacterium]